MLVKRLLVENPAGLHARPAAAFVREARRYQSTIRVRKNGDAVDAKSILGLLSLGLGQGSVIELQVSGADERAALEALERLVKGG
jgi:phosphotransferase system HPr (HPr) family protein